MFCELDAKPREVSPLSPRLSVSLTILPVHLWPCLHCILVHVVLLTLSSRFASRDASCFGASDLLCRRINSRLIAISSSAGITCHRILLLLYVVSGNSKVLRLCTQQCSIACSEAEASSSSLLLVIIIIYFQYLVSFFFSFVSQVSLWLGVVPSRVEFFPPASLFMSPSCLLTQHVTRGAASLAGCICICMQVRVRGWCLGLCGSGALWACGVLCGRALGPVERVANPIRALVAVAHRCCADFAATPCL